jgi:hypothetical protein
MGGNTYGIVWVEKGGEVGEERRGEERKRKERRPGE